SALTYTDFCTLSLHDALPILVVGDNMAIGIRDCRLPACIVISCCVGAGIRLGIETIVGIVGVGPAMASLVCVGRDVVGHPITELDRKSTRLNSSHRTISYAVF